MNDFEEILRGWHTLSPVLIKMNNIDELEQLLEHECHIGRRQHLIERIKSRIIKLRTDIIRKDLDDYCYKKSK